MKHEDYTLLPVDLLQEARMSGQDLEQVVNDPDVILGFELEFIAVPFEMEINYGTFNLYDIYQTDKHWIRDYTVYDYKRLKELKLKWAKTRAANLEYDENEVADWILETNPKLPMLFQTKALAYDEIKTRMVKNKTKFNSPR